MNKRQHIFFRLAMCRKVQRFIPQYVPYFNRIDALLDGYITRKAYFKLLPVPLVEPIPKILEPRATLMAWQLIRKLEGSEREQMIFQTWYETLIDRTISSAAFTCIFPMLRRPIQVNSTIYGIAQAAYQSPERDQMAILADAIEDTGYECAVTLNHLRHDRHFKGCCVIQRILNEQSSMATV